MSTTFGVLIREGKLLDLTQENVIIDIFEDCDIEVVEVAFRSSHGIVWETPLAPFLPDDTKVYALDNSQQGIYTIRDIKNALNVKDERETYTEKELKQ